MLIGDLDQNEQKELILTYDKCYFWEFSAPGAYTAWRSDFIFPGHVEPFKITDVDRDGILEIAALTAHPELQPPTYYLVKEFQQKSDPPDSTIYFSTITWFSQSWADFEMDVGDFDNDGATDIVSGNFGFVMGGDSVETRYFRYDETSYSPPNFRQYWLNPGIPLSCANPVIADMDNDGDYELFAGGLCPRGGSAFVWEATGLQTGYVAWLDTLSDPFGPHESSLGYVDGEACVVAAELIPAFPTKSQLILWAHSDSSYSYAWCSGLIDAAFYNNPRIHDMDGDGKQSIIVPDNIQHKLIDREQTSAAALPNGISILPAELQLYGNFPNPFNNSTIITFDLNHSGPVQLSIINLKAQLVYTKSEPSLQAGRNAITWNPEGVASGIYLFRLEHEAQVQTRKGVLMK
jgi:hypothetical protein